MTPGGVLEVRDLHVVLNESHILEGVEFAVPAGGVTALLGRNGAGKTTTLKAILGLVPRRGEIRLAGRDVGGLPTHAIVQRDVGYVPEDRDVFASLTVQENLRLAERSAAPRYDRVFALFPELRERARQRAGTLSGGQQQMLAIARALLNRNQILLIDEPTKGLAPLVIRQVMSVLREAAREVTILLVEQNLRAVRGLAHHAVVLDQGKTVYAGRFDDLAADPERLRRHLGVALA